jgi:alkylation response protein AidB-like acyl-CoA dehydrogenase
VSDRVPDWQAPELRPDDRAETAIRTAAELADEVLLPAAMEVERTGQIPASHLDALAASGLYGLSGPPEAGGLSVDHATAGRVIEILASGCLSTAFVWLQHHGAVRSVAASDNADLRDKWLGPLCRGERRAGLALAGAIPGPPMLLAQPVEGGYVFDGFSPWVTGWGLIDTLHAAGRDPDGNVIWGLIDAATSSTLSVEPLDLVAVMASRTVRADFRGCFVPAEKITIAMPLEQWQEVDASSLRSNGSLSLGLIARCCALIGPSPLDDQLVTARAGLDAGTAATMPTARAVAAELAVRAAAALVVAAGSRSVLTDSHAQRLAREAVFLLVFGSRPAIKDNLSRLLTAAG